MKNKKSSGYENKSPFKQLTLHEESKVLDKLLISCIKNITEDKSFKVGSFIYETLEMLKLKLAAENGLILTMTNLLRAKDADVNKPDDKGNMALDFATKAGNVEMIAFLKKSGAISGQFIGIEKSEESFAPASGEGSASVSEESFVSAFNTNDKWHHESGGLDANKDLTALMLERSFTPTSGEGFASAFDPDDKWCCESAGVDSTWQEYGYIP